MLNKSKDDTLNGLLSKRRKYKMSNADFSREMFGMA
jgi:hypothetical protein